MSMVLVVDDMAVVREPIAASLRAAGYTTVCASDGVGALSAARESCPDLVVLDLAMPGMDGLQVLRMLRACPETAKTPVILLTATAHKAHIVEAGCLGVRDYMVKARFSLPDLLDRVSKYLKPSESPSIPATAA